MKTEPDNLKERLLKEIKDEEDRINRLKLWIVELDGDGFDWDNVTQDQEWAIRNIKCSTSKRS